MERIPADIANGGDSVTAIIIIGILILAFFTLTWRLSSMIVQPKRWDYDKCFEEEMRRGGFTREQYAAYHAEDFFVDSAFGYAIHGVVIPKKEGVAFEDGRERVAVIAHGYSYALFGSVKYAGIFHDLGFHCVLYDQRNHGKTGRKPTTMGHCEAQDLAVVVQWARERYGEDCVLGTHGESMGAATVMLHAPTDPRLAFVIEDCGYADLVEQLKYNVHNMFHIPKQPFVAAGSLLSKLRGGVFFRDVMPAKAVARCPESLPMLFVHGMEDHFVPTEMVYANYNAKRGERRIRTYEGSKHAKSYLDHPQEYADMVRDFLTDYHII